MNTMLTFFIILFIILALFQLLLLIFLTSKKLKKGKVHQHEQVVYDKAMPLFIQYLYNDQDEHIPLPPDEYHVGERLFSDSMAITTDERLRRKIYESASYYLSSYYERVMKTGDWPARVNALYYIENFRMESMQPVLKRRLLEIKIHDEEKQQLIRTMAAIGDLTILDYLENDSETTESVFLSAFTRFPEEVVPTAIEIVSQSGSSKAVISLLMYMGRSKRLDSMLFIEEKLFHELPEMRIQALKALFRMSYLSTPELLVSFFKSEIWEERMFAAKITGALSLSQFESELHGLLGDSVWWVRYSAAEAILQTFGESKLLMLSQRHPDPFARDMAAQWLKTDREVPNHA